MLSLMRVKLPSSSYLTIHPHKYHVALEKRSILIASHHITNIIRHKTMLMEKNDGLSNQRSAFIVLKKSDFSDNHFSLLQCFLRTFQDLQFKSLNVEF